MTPPPRPLVIPACSVLALLASLPLAAQTRVPLQGGFVPDPWTIEIGTTGTVAAGDSVRGCPGYVAEIAPLTISLTDPVERLRFYGHGEGIAGFLVTGPDGITRCAAVGPAGVAVLRVDPMQPGDYTIFPATMTPGAAVTANVAVSEGDLGSDAILRPFGLAPAALSVDAEPAAGTLSVPDEGTLSTPLTLSALTGADLAAAHCTGHIDPSRPDAALILQSEEQVSVRLRSEIDTTLVVIGPDGTVECNDDADGTDPEVVLRAPVPGRWAIWAGAYESNARGTALLEIDRGGPPAASLAFDAPPALGPHPLAGGMLTLPVTLTGSIDASEINWDCVGLIEPTRPDAVVRLDAEEAALVLRARSIVDTTLVVRGPDGVISCDDDSVDLDPVITFGPAAAGDYAIWVGAYGDSGGAATLLVGRSAAEVGSDHAALGSESVPFAENPFEGRSVASAAEAVQILLEQPMLAGMVSYGALRERGPEGVELSEVQVAVPTGMRAPISIDRIVVSELDLEGLAATGDPARFVLRIEGIDYAALVEAGQGLPLPQLPDLSGVPGLSLAMSLLPPDDDPLAREAAVDLVLDGQFAVGLDARLDLHGLAPDALEAAPTREMSVSFENRGFLGTLLREQARAAGMEREAMVATALEGLAEAFAPLEPGSLQERLVAVLGEALADPDRPGVIRLALSTEEAGGLRPILEALQVDPAASDRLAFDLSFQPLP